MEKKIEAPYVIIKHRAPQGTVRHHQRIDRYWKHKETGTTVEVKKYYVDIDRATTVVTFMDPTVNHTLSMDEPEFRKKYECVGNISSKF